MSDSIIHNHIPKGGIGYRLEYCDTDWFDHLDYNKCRQVYGVCFYGEKMVIGFGGQKQGWGLIGGSVATGGTFEQTLAREIQEESNMKVLSCLPIGYQKVIAIPDRSYIYQLRYACMVEPFDSFVSDPTGGVIKIKLIEPTEYKKYFDWGEIGERIITRAQELKSRLSTNPPR